MKVLRARNVNDLYVQGLELLATDGKRSESRAGPVVVAPWPVMSVYERPMERVLFDPARDANPFFHLMEGLWMLAGRNDAKFLDRYIKDFGSRFAEKDGTIHDAYGHRWRDALNSVDQLEVIVGKLCANPNDRQAVLQMWDAGDDGMSDLTGDWKGRPCNTHIYFRVRTILPWGAGDTLTYPVLDMTICCRSNDIVWGAYGANAVHFSMLMEYMAGRIGCAVGTMYQMSNNYHGYLDVLDKLGDPSQLPDSDYYDRAVDPVMAMPMAENWNEWDNDLRKFMRWHDWLYDQTSEFTDISVGVTNTTENSWFMGVAVPVAQANWLRRRNRAQEALEMVDRIDAADWRAACKSWLLGRQKL